MRVTDAQTESTIERAGNALPDAPGKNHAPHRPLMLEKVPRTAYHPAKCGMTGWPVQCLAAYRARRRSGLGSISGESNTIRTKTDLMRRTQ